MKNILVGLFLGLSAASSAAQADASASVTSSTPMRYSWWQSIASQNCWQYDSTWRNDAGQPCLSTAKVTIAPSVADKGMPGAFFIGAQAGNQTIAVYSQNGWEPFRGGSISPAAYFDAIPSSVTSTVLDNQNICAMSGDKPIEVWAGYGVLTPDKERVIQNYHKIRNPSFSPDYLRSVYVQDDMRKNEKFWKVLEVPCLPPPPKAY